MRTGPIGQSSCLVICAVLSVAMLLVIGCGEDDAKTNELPEVQMTSCPAADAPLGTDCIFSWWSSDADGSVSGYYYDLDNATPGTWIGANACTLSSLAAGDHTFYVQAVDNDDARSTVASCDFSIAAAVAGCQIAPASLDFGSVDVGSSTDLTFTITNSGTGTLAGSVTETCDHYAFVSGGGAYSLAPAAVHTVTVRYSPTAAGTHACTIDLGADACADVACTGTGTDVASCGVSVASLDFGSVDVGSSADLTFTITNNGTGTLAGTVAESCDHYAFVTGGGAYSLAPAAVHTVTVRFSPTTAGIHTCTIDLGADACADVACTGTGTDVASCGVSVASLDFGSVDVGSSADLTFTITNNGTGTLAGSVTETCDHYAFVTGGGAYSLAPAAVHTVTVQFSPTTAGTHACTIDLGADACADVACTGMGTDVASCGVSVASLDFGSVDVGSSADLTFTITNTGTGTLAGSVTETCDHYAFVTGGGAYSLAPAAVHTVTVQFSPTVAGTHTCTIDLGADACADVACTGTGTDVASCGVSVASLDFGSVDVGSSADLTFTITNTGTGTLAGTVAETCDHYAFVSGGGAYSLAPAAVHTVTVRYSPTAAGTHACTIDLGEAICTNVSCTGVGTDVVSCDLSVSSLDFGSVEVGTFVDQLFTITNNGTSAVTGLISTIHPLYHIVTGGGAFDIPAGGTLDVVVRFTPSIAGIEAGTIDLGNAACSALSFTGTGLAGNGVELNDGVYLMYHWAADLLSTLDGVFTYDLDGYVPDFEVGDIIVGDIEDGVTYVRRIVSVTETATQLILGTTPAELVDAFKELIGAGQIDIPMDIPGAGGFLLPGVLITNDGLTLNDLRLEVPGVGYVELDNGFVKVEELSVNTEFDIQSAGVAEYENFLHCRLSFGFDLAAGLDLAANGPEMSPSYETPELEVYSNTLVKRDTLICINVGSCPCILGFCDIDCTKWKSEKCTYVQHDISYKVYLGAEFDFTATAAQQGDNKSGSPATTIIELDGLDGGVVVDVGDRYLTGVWESIRDSQIIDSESYPPMPPAFVAMMVKPYVIVEVEDKVRLFIVEQEAVAFPAPTTRVKYFLVAATTADVTEWCYEVGAGREIEIIDAPVPSQFRSYIDDQLFETLEPEWLNAEDWEIYQDCQNWIPFPVGEK